MQIFFVLLFFGLTRSQKTEAKRAIEPFQKGKIEIDELTQFTNPESFDFDFSDDLKEAADSDSIYQQLLPALPPFDLHLRGKNAGTTLVPIVTRRGALWATPTRHITEAPYTWSQPTIPPNRKFIPDSEEDSGDVSASFEQRTTTTTRRPSTLFPSSTVPSTTTTRTTVIEITTQRPRVQWTTVAAPSSSTRRRAPIWRKGTVIFDEQTTQTTPTAQTFHLVPELEGITAPLVRTTPPTASTSRGTTKFFTISQQVLTPTVRSKHREFTKMVDSVTTTRAPKKSFNSSTKKFAFQRASSRAPSGTRRPAPKPLLLHLPNFRYSGPTYNCRVLDPALDGTASPNHDPSCKMILPGFAADLTCRCTYTVEARDEKGCATGFIYNCYRVK